MSALLEMIIVRVAPRRWSRCMCKFCLCSGWREQWISPSCMAHYIRAKVEIVRFSSCFVSGL